MDELNGLLRRIDVSETQDRHRSQMKESADAAFRDHLITEEQPGVFYCAKPGSGHYSFRVAFLPAGLIVIYGDIGDMMVQRGGEDWLRGAIRHDYISDYIFEKMLPRRGRYDKKSEFLPGEAVVELRRMHDGVPCKDAGGLSPKDDDYWEQKPDPETALKIATDWLAWDESGRDAEAWHRAGYEHTGDCEFSRCADYDPNSIWCYHALSWFVRERTRQEQEAVSATS